MSPTSKSRKRKRRSQLVAVRAVPVGYQPRRPRIDHRTMAQQFDDWMLSRLSARVAALLFVLTCGIASALSVVAAHTINDLHAYENAPTCNASITTSCRQDVSVVITALDETITGRNNDHRTYYLDVSGLSQTTTRLELHDGSGVWLVSREGEEAMVELWNGVPVSITADGLTSQTSDAPHKTMVEVTSVALAALAGAAMFAVFWIRRLHYHRSGGERWPEWLTLLEPTFTFATVGLLVGAFIGAIAESLIVTVAVGAGVTLFALAIFTASWWLAKARRT